MSTDDLESAIGYVEVHAPVRAWLLRRKRIVDVVSLTVLELERLTIDDRRLSKEELVRRIVPRFRRSPNWPWWAKNKVMLSRLIFLSAEWWRLKNG